MSIATVARLLGLPVKWLHHAYRNYLSDYCSDVSQGKWPAVEVMDVDEQTGEIFSEKPLYVFKPENIGEEMSIDDKQIGGNGYTILRLPKT